ncbi:hypothetical protein [Actinoplanes derwentensis]|nr:hypothetical protein [Actinoplanes derwentensis]
MTQPDETREQEGEMMSAKQMWQAATASSALSPAAPARTAMSQATMALPSSPARSLSRLPGRWRG